MNLLLMNQLEAYRSVLRAERPFSDRTILTIWTHRAAEPADVRTRSLIAGTTDLRASGADECRA
jgi:hypothetical protein